MRALHGGTALVALLAAGAAVAFSPAARAQSGPAPADASATTTSSTTATTAPPDANAPPAGPGPSPAPHAERVTLDDGASDGAREGDEVVGFQQRPALPGQYVLWAEPLATFAYAVSGALSLSLGADLPLTPSLSLVLQSGLTVGSRGVFSQFGTGRESAVVLDTAVGLSWLFVNVQRTGPVVIPKLAVQLANLNEALGTAGQSAQVLTAVIGPGLDVGFQFAMEHVRVTLLVGGSVGYCYCATLANAPGSLGTMFEVRRYERWQPGFNLNLFRAGIAF